MQNQTDNNKSTKERWPIPETKGWVAWAMMVVVLTIGITALWLMWETKENYKSMDEACELSRVICKECAPAIICPVYYDGMKKRMLDEGYDMEAVNKVIQENLNQMPVIEGVK